MRIREKLLLISIAFVLTVVLIECALRLGGFVYFSFLRQRNLTEAAARDAYRVMVVGESTTAYGGDDAYPKQLESILNRQKKDKAFEVINVAVPGVTTETISRSIKKDLKTYDPDVVVLMIGINDWYYDKVIAKTPMAKFKYLVLGKLKTYKLLKLVKNNLKEKWKSYRAQESMRETLAESRKEADSAEENLYHENDWINHLYADFVGSKKSNAFDNNPCVRVSRTLDENLESHDSQFPQFQSVENDLLSRLETDGNDASLWADLGICYEKHGKYREAAAALEKSLELKPELWMYEKLGGIFEKLGELEKAQTVYSKVFAEYPANYWVLMKLSEVQMKQEKYEEARDFLKKAIKLHPQNYRFYKKMALTYDAMGDTESAEKYHQLAQDKQRISYHPLTVRSYHEIVRQILGVDKKLVCMQYALKDVDSLKTLLSSYEKIVFVDNEKVFLQAMKNSAYDELFFDKCAYDMGHATREGNRLIAENAAAAILKHVSSKEN